LNCSRIVSRNLAVLDSADGNVDRIIASSVETEGELSEAEGYLRAMDVEFRTMSSADKRRAQQKVTEYREEFRRLQLNYQSSKSTAENVAMSKGPAVRSKLLNANQRLDESTLTLEQSRQIIAQTENIGNAVITDLSTQKEKLVDAREKVKETKDFTTEARRVLRMMGNRAIMHKICVAFTIVALGGAIVATAYYGLAK
jgi:vesicle transport through interaction with t-SNAREs protein 1